MAPTDDLRDLTPDELLEHLARVKREADDVYLTWLAAQAQGPAN